MPSAQATAIAQANSELNSAGLPTYSQLLTALATVVESARQGAPEVIGYRFGSPEKGHFDCGWNHNADRIWSSSVEARALLRLAGFEGLDGDGCAEPEFVIRSLSEGQEDLDGDAGAFWSNEDGWVSLQTADRYTASERLRAPDLPISASGDAQWVALSEVSAS